MTSPERGPVWSSYVLGAPANIFSDLVSGASSEVAVRNRSGRVSLAMVRHDCQYCLYSGPLVYGRSQRRHRSCTCSATRPYLLDGIVGKRWCSIWYDRFPDMKCMS